MLHLCTALFLGLVVQVLPQLGNDRVMEGMLIDSDVKDNIVIVRTSEGILQQLPFDHTSRAFTSNRTLLSFRDPTLRRGIQVRVVTGKSSLLIKELTCIPAASKP